MSPEQRPPLWEVMRSASEEARMDPVAPGNDYAALIRAMRDWLVPDPDDELLTADERDIRDWLTAEAERAEAGGGGMIDLHQLPVWPQSQQSLTEQMASLIHIANRLGLFDAADAVRQLTPRLDEVKYGCHLDLEPGEQPDGCVIDEDRLVDCIYAKPSMRKEQCKYWRIIAIAAELEGQS